MFVDDQRDKSYMSECEYCWHKAIQSYTYWTCDTLI